MESEQIKRSLDWYRRMGDVRVYFLDGTVQIGRATRVTDAGFTLSGFGRVAYSDVDAAESAMFA